MIPICCHRFPLLSVTFTAGQYGGGFGGSVSDRFAFVVSQPTNATRNDPSWVVIADVPIPNPDVFDPVTCCKRNG